MPTIQIDRIGGCGIYQRPGDSRGWGRGTDMMTARPVELWQPWGRVFITTTPSTLHPPGSFRVAFLLAAEKMQEIILQLKEGKIDCLLPPGTIRKPHSGDPHPHSHQANPPARFLSRASLVSHSGHSLLPC